MTRRLILIFLIFTICQLFNPIFFIGISGIYSLGKSEIYLEEVDTPESKVNYNHFLLISQPMTPYEYPIRNFVNFSKSIFLFFTNSNIITIKVRKVWENGNLYAGDTISALCPKLLVAHLDEDAKLHCINHHKTLNLSRGKINITVHDGGSISWRDKKKSGIVEGDCKNHPLVSCSVTNVIKTSDDLIFSTYDLCSYDIYGIDSENIKKALKKSVNFLTKDHLTHLLKCLQKDTDRSRDATLIESLPGQRSYLRKVN